MSRLTDEELARLLGNALQNDGQVEKWLDLKRSTSMLAELIERRAADLSAEERLVLREIQEVIAKGWPFGTVHLAVMTKLLKGGG